MFSALRGKMAMMCQRKTLDGCYMSPNRALMQELGPGERRVIG